MTNEEYFENARNLFEELDDYAVASIYCYSQLGVGEECTPSVHFRSAALKALRDSDLNGIQDVLKRLHLYVRKLDSTYRNGINGVYLYAQVDDFLNNTELPVAKNTLVTVKDSDFAISGNGRLIITVNLDFDREILKALYLNSCLSENDADQIVGSMIIEQLKNKLPTI